MRVRTPERKSMLESDEGAMDDVSSSARATGREKKSSCDVCLRFSSLWET